MASESSQKCEDCGSQNFTRNEELGEVVCADCGLVFDDESTPFEKTTSGGYEDAKTHSPDNGKVGTNAAQFNRSSRLGMAAYRTGETNRSERMIASIIETRVLLTKLDPDRKQSTKNEEDEIMKKLRHVGIKTSSGIVTNKRLLQGYPTELTATVMAHMIHHYIRDSIESKPKLKNKISKSLSGNANPASTEQLKLLNKCFNKFWDVFLEMGWVSDIRKKNEEDVIADAQLELKDHINTLTIKGILPQEFEVQEKVTQNLLEIKSYPKSKSALRNAINMELIYQLAKKAQVNGVARKDIAGIMNLNSYKDNHKSKVLEFLNGLGE